jgi:hypothetical protein
MTFMAERLKSASKQKKPKLRKRIGKKDFLFFNDGTAKKNPTQMAKNRVLLFPGNLDERLLPLKVY